MKEKIQVKMLDKLSISFENSRIEDSAKRPSRVWLLLAYLLYHRDRVVLQEELIERLWGGGAGENPYGALRTGMWRTRQLLEELDPENGSLMILSCGSGYRWNADFPVETDYEAFEALCRESAKPEDPKARCAGFRQALAMYQRDFLDRYALDAWVSPLSAYYNTMYVEAALQQLDLLQAADGAEEAAALCDAVLRVSPYQERVYRHLMRAYMAMGRFDKADETYEKLRAQLFDNLGVMPDKESRLLHKEALRHLNHPFLSADMLRDQLEEKDPEPGPVVCDFYAFRQFYQEEARSVSRRGTAIHVGMLTLTEKGGRELHPAAMAQAMDQMQQQLSFQLRLGDIVSRCSASQFVLLLQANYENSSKVCERVIGAFERACPYAPVTVQYTVLSLEPLQIGAEKQKGDRTEKKGSWKKRKA